MHQEALLQLAVISSIRWCMVGSRDGWVEDSMYCTSALISGCGLLTWVKMDRTTSCSSQVTFNEQQDKLTPDTVWNTSVNSSCHLVILGCWSPHGSE